MSSPRLVLVLGGTRSGKSAVAERLAAAAGGPVRYLATAPSGPDGDGDRIALHRSRRPASWETLEVAATEDLALPIREAAGATVLLDGLGAWLAGVLHASGLLDDDGRREDPAGAIDGAAALAGIEHAVQALADAACGREGLTVVVGEEAGMAPVAPTRGTRRWVDLLGTAHQALAARADRVLLVVAGRAIELHDVGAGPEIAGPRPAQSALPLDVAPAPAAAVDVSPPASAVDASTPPEPGGPDAVPPAAVAVGVDATTAAAIGAGETGRPTDPLPGTDALAASGDGPGLVDDATDDVAPAAVAVGVDATTAAAIGAGESGDPAAAPGPANGPAAAADGATAGPGGTATATDGASAGDDGPAAAADGRGAPGDGATPAPAASSPAAPSPDAPLREALPVPPGARMHGDRMVPDGMLDFAVNVVAGDPPGWARQAMNAGLDAAGRYPDDRPAAVALAGRHGRAPEGVLPLGGAVEGFWRLALAVRPRRAAVVVPGFTEAEAALRTVGAEIVRVPRRPEQGWMLDPEAVPEDCDMVVVGRPENPTGVLDHRETILRLRRPGRTVLVDEAFADFVPREDPLRDPEGPAGPPAGGALADERPSDAGPGDLVVLRSLTKVLSVPGVRCGYLLADPELVDRVRDAGAPWSCPTPALELLRAYAGRPEACDRIAARTAAHRGDLLARLRQLAGVQVWDGTANFVLLRAPADVDVVGGLHGHGIAVRPCTTFAGLDDRYVRIAVRTPALHAQLTTALARVL
ncbi:MAG: aminotransferase class I/II-fold pyridoxal phosphate-dependent enzyme, partial [Actinobacteria bacterium]|nr:aminotransferase class I/II-fold pyridoxal phosphate-dependent enzyme [Actinomycetota bacterium]